MEQEIIEMNLSLFIEYMKVRAKEENVEWSLSDDFVTDAFNNGTRNMFGVELNNIAFPLWDDQEPQKGFLNMFISGYILQ